MEVPPEENGVLALHQAPQPRVPVLEREVSTIFGCENQIEGRWSHRHASQGAHTWTYSLMDSFALRVRVERATFFETEVLVEATIPLLNPPHTLCADICDCHIESSSAWLTLVVLPR